jgi:hypothetical protein
MLDLILLLVSILSLAALGIFGAHLIKSELG